MQPEESAANSKESRKILLFCKCWWVDTAITYRLLAICFLDKAHV